MLTQQVHVSKCGGLGAAFRINIQTPLDSKLMCAIYAGTGRLLKICAPFFLFQTYHTHHDFSDGWSDLRPSGLEFRLLEWCSLFQWWLLEGMTSSSSSISSASFDSLSVWGLVFTRCNQGCDGKVNVIKWTCVRGGHMFSFEPGSPPCAILYICVLRSHCSANRDYIM